MATKIERLAVDGGEPVRATPLETGYPGARLIGDEERELVLEVLDRQAPFRFYGVNEPDKVAQLEREAARMMGTSYALGVTSGTAALKVGLKALDIAPGDEVIVPALTFIASPGTVAAHHAIPVFADINESLTLDPHDIENRITPRTRAIMPVHTSGVAAEMDTIMEIARRHDLPVIEDCAQSAGTAYKDKSIGAWGDVGAFSLQVNKIITAGEGGIVTTSDPVMFERAVRYHDHGNYRFGRMSVETSAPDDTMGDLTVSARTARCLPGRGLPHGRTRGRAGIGADPQTAWHYRPDEKRPRHHQARDTGPARRNPAPFARSRRHRRCIARSACGRSCANGALREGAPG